MKANKTAIENTFFYTFNIAEGLKMYNMNEKKSISESTYRKYVKQLIAEHYGVNYTDWTQKKSIEATKVCNQVKRLKLGFMPNRKLGKYRSTFTKNTREYFINKVNHKCERCGTDLVPGNWEIDHIDGNHCNGFLSNLQILCRNCHGIKTNNQIKNGLYKNLVNY